MKNLSFVLIGALLVTLGSAALARNDKDAAALNQIAGYRQWTRVNPKPVEVLVPVTRTSGASSIDAAAMS